MWLAACASTPADDAVKANQDRDDAVESLHQTTGAPVAIEITEGGVTRTVSMTPSHVATTRAANPASAAASFLAANHDVFQLSAEDAATFVATRVDVEPKFGVSHVTMQRTVGGIPVFQGGINVLMDASHNVVRVTTDELFRVGQPTNRMLLSPAQAADAAAKAFGVQLGAIGAGTAAGQATVFTSPNALDEIKVETRIYQVAPGDDRLVHQVLLAWLDEHKEQQYQLALVDAETGKMVYNGSLVASAFSGRVFSFGHQPAPGDTTDNRTVVSFDGDPTASPNGWVTGNATVGNNAVAATDIDGNNTVGANETQPTATGGVFDFPYSPATDSASERQASVTNSFFYVNDWHDRTYALGFTEAAGNFQANNFGRGGAQNDPVNVDAQDGSGTNNANFGTPPDGSSPRMQMFLFNILNGNTLRQDGDFDGTVVYHENTHGLSNRLVGNGATTCLNGLQSGGMGEGWSDIVAASFLNNPVIGAYVTGNTTVGIRRMSMANSTFTYDSIKDRTLAEVHDVGELWAATLWDIRKALGQNVTERLIVQGMKNTPCNPTMLNARDGIIAADASLNAGANKCALWTVFAARHMGTGAASPNHNSTTQITTSTAVPTECGGGPPPPTGTTRNFSAAGLPLSIPDNNATGVRSTIAVTPTGLDLLKITVDINITHTFRGDLVVQVIAPNGATATLSNRAGGAADNFITTGQDITASFPAGTPASGNWQLFVRDLAAADTGRITAYALHVTSTN